MSKPSKEMDPYDFMRAVSAAYGDQEHDRRVLVRTLKGTQERFLPVGAVRLDEDGDLIIETEVED